MKIDYPYLRSYRDRRGKLRIEYRRGGRLIRIHGLHGSQEFQAAYEDA